MAATTTRRSDRARAATRPARAATTRGVAPRRESRPRPAPRRARRARRVDTGRRIVVLGAVIAALAVALVARVAWIGSVDRAEYRALGAERRAFTRELAAPRGSIVDRNGETMVMSVPADLVAVDPALVEDAETTATELAVLLGVERRAVLAALETDDRRYVEIARDLAPEVGDRVREADLAGILVERRPKRERIGGDIAASLVGRMDPYGVEALSGLEKLFDDDLAPTPGEMRGERDVDLKIIPGTERVTAAARAGSDLWLTIDRPLQYVAEKVLIEQMNRVGAANATVVVGRTKTSEILAMASVTRDDQGVAVADTLNQAIREYEPGSVMKMATVAAAYDRRVVEPSSTLSVPGSITLGDYEISDHETHGTVTMTVDQILAKSSNVGTIKVAQAVGRATLLDYYELFGFGSTTSLGLPKEQAGLVPQHWNASDIGSIPIGQTVTVTPLQMWAAYNVIANDGMYIPPRLVLDMVDAEGRHAVPDVGRPRRVVSSAAAAKVNGTLQQVIEEGTGQEWQIDGFHIAAKTGTAYKPLGDDLGYGNEHNRKYRSSFVGYFPASDPEISIMVMLDEPKPPHHLGTVAAGPVFDELAKEAMRRYAIAGDDLDESRDARRAAPAVRPTPTTIPVDSDATATSSTVPPGSPGPTTRSDPLRRPAPTSSPPDDEAVTTPGRSATDG